ncbi:abortive phage infection protein [Streptomyces sp. NBC_00378]|uniref:abortive phage infection protein n=1 Tax=Streptomyces sp. NBC_00378 TaxID=2975732 RepID=UPI00224FE809|nr:abortive phage infection protein [Streptomyces sp. NBC_00378]MCX5110155.1 abortive phage infection protein [Streptomyces sp. NBC_00378]
MHRDECSRGISRAKFLAGAGAIGAAAATGPLLAGAPASAAMTDPRDGHRIGNGNGKGLTHRGICYTIGAGETPGTAWSTARMRKDLRAIRNDMHATSIEVTGDGVDRLNATATEAAELGLHIWLQPTLGDRPAPEILDHLAETGRHLERLRRQGARADLSVGCEFWLFVPGIVPGDDAQERIRNLMAGNFDPEQMMRRLSEFTARAAAVGRSVFGGKLSYAATQDDEVDWNLFDIVGIDYYSYFPDRADYVRELRSYLRWGKPVAITEFGTCTYAGAPQQGGMGWDTIDYTKQPPEIKGDLVRSERTQAAYLTELLGVFEEMGLYVAMAFEFITADAPHSPVPRYDLDMASYAVVKPIKDRFDDPESDWHWEPKQAFHALARCYGRAGRH